MQRMKDQESDTEIHVSPGVAVARALPEDTQLRNYAHIESSSKQSVLSD